MTAFSQTIIHVARGTCTRLWARAQAAPEQGGPLTGEDTPVLDTSDPLRIWIIQVGVIMLTTQLLSLLLRKIRQPRVIAEVFGGILLGPTAFGRIPGFTNRIFPPESQPFLALVANIGLVLFLFLVGLEIEGSVIKRNARLSAQIALAGMILPFGIGAGLSVALYKEFVDPSTQFTHFMLFVGVAFSITAFPVLCRILTELKLLDTTVGVVVLSAGVANDLVGWTLLALSVALVNAASGLTALWILLTCVGWALFLLFLVRRAVLWLARRTGSIENGPTMLFMTITMLIVFGSAFFTDVIGVHAIFGAFLTGLIIPREGGLAIALTEKLEDMVSIIFLPLYFTLSGLSTDLGLLNNGVTWAYTIAICTLAYIGKFGGCTIAARTTGFRWREAASIGTLMSCKGLVELIVLKVGLAAGILNTRVFSMFVLEAMLLTFLTTPVVATLYPPKYRKRAVGTGANFSGIGDDVVSKDGDTSAVDILEHDEWKTRFTVVLDKMEHLSGIMTVTQLFRPFALEPEVLTSEPACEISSGQSTPSLASTSAASPIIDALRLIELSDRASAVMKSSVADSLILTDPLLSVFRTFSELNSVIVSASLSVVPSDELGTTVANHARENLSQLVLIPWLPYTVPIAHTPGYHNPTSHHHDVPSTSAAGAVSNNPFDVLLNFTNTEQSWGVHSRFVRDIFSRSTVDVALYVDRGRAGPGHYSKQHILLPFFGGPDDRLALAMVVQLCANPATSAKIVRVTKREVPVNEPERPERAHLAAASKRSTVLAASLRDNVLIVNSASGPPQSAAPPTQTQFETADDTVWQSYASPTRSSRLLPAIRGALARVEFLELGSPTPLRDVLVRANIETDAAVQQKARPFVVVGRTRRLAAESYHAELQELLEEKGHVALEMIETMGDVATAFVTSENAAGLVVVQSADNHWR